MEQQFVLCDECEDEMIEFDEAKSQEYDGQSLDTDGNLWIFWKPEDCKQHKFFCCLECQAFKVSDLHYNEYQFVGHMGFAEDDKEWSRNPKSRKKTELTSGSKISDPNTPRWDMSDSEKMDFKVDGWLPTGPQGGHKVFWYNCSTRKDISFTDK